MASSAETLALCSMITVGISIVISAVAVAIVIVTFRAQRKTLQDINSTGQIIQNSQQAVIKGVPKDVLSETIANVGRKDDDSSSVRVHDVQVGTKVFSRSGSSNLVSETSKEGIRQKESTKAKAEEVYGSLSLDDRLPTYLQDENQREKKAKMKEQEEKKGGFVHDEDLQQYMTLAGLDQEDLLPMDNEPRKPVQPTPAPRNFDDEPFNVEKPQQQQPTGPRNFDDEMLEGSEKAGEKQKPFEARAPRNFD